MFEKQNFLSQLSAANTQSPQANSLLDQAEESLAKKDFKTAKDLIKQSLKSGASEDAYLKLGILENLQGNNKKAIKAYEECLGMNPFNETALINIGDIYNSEHRYLQAIQNYGLAVNANPDVSEYKEKLIGILKHYNFKQINEVLRAVILLCIKDRNVNLTSMGNSWLSIVLMSPDFNAIFKPQALIDYKAFKANIESQKDISGLYDDFFLSGLKRILGTNLNFEKFITYVRRYLLENRAAFADDEKALHLISALAVYSHFTEFVLDETDEEETIIQSLLKSCESGKASPHDIAHLACYRPLSKLKNRETILENLDGNEDLEMMLETHIRQPIEMEEIRPTIKSLTTIDNKVSSNVQSQYEEFPYPRWDGYSKPERPQDSKFWGKKAKILNAGCGTGHEAVDLAIRYPDADITAVDLSLSSLSYAKMKAKQYGIPNISFNHGDILKLGDLDQKFDFIASSGVLHHMEDPMAGWTVLNGLLKDDGQMRIALYSKHARYAVTESRNVIAEKNLKSDAKSIKEFRRNLKDHVSKKSYEALIGYRDFYTLSECRDLLFHVQEHQFDIPQIKECLDKLDLEFKGFLISPKVIDRFEKRYRDENAKTNLDDWHEFELKNPDTFIGMYQFWCERKGNQK